MHGGDLADGNGEQIPSAVQDAGPVGAVLCSLFGPPRMVTGGAADDDGDGDGRGSGRSGGDGHGCLASLSEASASRALAKFTQPELDLGAQRARCWRRAGKAMVPRKRVWLIIGRLQPTGRQPELDLGAQRARCWRRAGKAMVPRKRVWLIIGRLQPTGRLG